MQRAAHSPTPKTMGIVLVAAWAAMQEGHPRSLRSGRHFGEKPVGSVLGPTVFNGDVFAFDIADVIEALEKCAHPVSVRRCGV